MKIITAPDTVGYTVGYYHLFLAGGISGCGNWQREMIGRLKTDLNNTDSLCIFNPRRENFDTSDPSVSEQQITWERKAMTASDGILFWFPHETLCPITLLELGYWLGKESNRHLFVGTHPAYQRRFDVQFQTNLTYKTRYGTSFDVHDNWESLIKDFGDHYDLCMTGQYK